MAAGLGARDSTRIEAGFPLFGHELEGPAGLSLTEAGYGFVPKLTGRTPPFIGQAPYEQRTAVRAKRVLRLRGKGRTVREGNTVIDAETGQAVGIVTSAA